MPFVQPAFSKSQVNKAGSILVASDERPQSDRAWADAVLANWRACHGYPMNTFQATLRSKLKRIDNDAIVAQRLKRAPSIILKLKRFPQMSLARMQDIGGLRAVLLDASKARATEAAYKSARFSHDLVNSKNYIDEPKKDGYRGIHLIYRYSNSQAQAYDGLCLELQLRTRLQHAWATAVETMGTFLDQALKSGQGDAKWRQFFACASAALALREGTAAVPGFEDCSSRDLAGQLTSLEGRLHVLATLRGFAIATAHITRERGQGAYHLITLNSQEKTVHIKPYPVGELERANLDYAEMEGRARNGEPIEAVLVAAGPVDTLRKAYPNYFLDTNVFVREIRRAMSIHYRQSASR